MKNLKIVKGRAGFTLVEVMVGVIIIAALSTVAWMASTVLFRSGEMTRQQSNAVNLLQYSQEEVRSSAQAGAIFDTLESCTFPPALGNNCGFDDSSAEYPDFTRSLTVTPVSGSADFKHVVTTVQWTEMGRARTIDSVSLLARPPLPLPGNIIGSVAALDDPGTPLTGVTVVATSLATSEIFTEVTDATGFNFRDQATGQYVLPAGSWSLTLSHTGFQTETLGPYFVPVKKEITVGILLLKPNPKDATIKGIIIDQSTGTQVANMDVAKVQLHEDGSHIKEEKPGTGTYSFIIPFTDSNPKTFTLNTFEAFKAGYTYKMTKDGGNPSCTYEYHRDGWSSAVVQGGGSIACTNPFIGNLASDRIVVNSGDDLTHNITLSPVPLVELKGRVMTKSGQPVKGAIIRAKWPGGNDNWKVSGVRQDGVSNSQGYFSYFVPAIQGMFSPSSKLLVWAVGQVKILGCCQKNTKVWEDSNYYYMNNLNPGDSARTIPDLVIPDSGLNCGNVQGNIKNGQSNSGIGGAKVDISYESSTNGSGYYIKKCSSGESGFRLPVDSYRSVVSKSGYYTNKSSGNAYYASRPNAKVTKNAVATHNAFLWPKKFGKVVVNVKDNFGAPAVKVQVEIQPFSGAALVGKTSGSGQVVFNNVPESWPPAGLPSNGHYNTSTQKHKVNLKPDPLAFGSVPGQTFKLQAGETKTISFTINRVNGL